MKRISVGLLLATSLLFLDVSPAAAHQGVDRVHDHGHSYRIEARRFYEMPRWLKRNTRFRHWYRHTPLKRYRQISWNQLYEIYRWERRYFRSRHYIAYDERRRGDERRRYRHDD